MSDQTPRSAHEASIALLEELYEKHPEIDRNELAGFLMLLTNAARNAVKQVTFALREPTPGETIDEMQVVDLMRDGVIDWDTPQMQKIVTQVRELSRDDDLKTTEFLWSLAQQWSQKILETRFGTSENPEQ